MKILTNRRLRRIVAVTGALGLVVAWLVANPRSYEQIFTKVENDGAASGIEASASGIAENGGANGDYSAEATSAANVNGDYSAEATSVANANVPLATEILEKLEVKGRAPKTGYSREEFYGGWPTVDGCSLRQRIIRREFGESAALDGCTVVAGEYDEPYTGEHKVFKEKSEISNGVQIDHVVALSDAWQKGAQYFTAEVRYNIATDPLNLLAVDGRANQKKSDGDAATWLPANKKFRCQYVARQVSVKYKYGMWVTEAEKTAISGVLSYCPSEPSVGV